jgi:hypothetical protein
MWTTLKKRSPHAHSHNKCKCQTRDDIDQETAVRFTSIRHIAHIRRAPPTDSPEEAFNGARSDFSVAVAPRLRGNEPYSQAKKNRQTAGHRAGEREGICSEPNKMFSTQKVNVQTKFTIIVAATLATFVSSAIAGAADDGGTPYNMGVPRVLITRRASTASYI